MDMKMLLTNNIRKMHGLPLHRKRIKRKDILPDVKQWKHLKHFLITSTENMSY